MLTSIIVEDEKIAAERLLRLINETELNVENKAIIESIEETVKYLNENEIPDIIFLDIHVADSNSFELFNLMEVKSKVIFTTAYSEYGAQAFRQNAVDYLLKPIKKDELREAIGRIIKAQSTNEGMAVPQGYNEVKDRFLIKFGSKLTVVKTADIAYIYSENKIGYFMQHNGVRVASDYKLQDLENLLDPHIFFRVNRQFIVNIDSIQNMNTYTKARINLKLNPVYEGDIIVSTEKTPEFKDWLKGRMK